MELIISLPVIINSISYTIASDVDVEKLETVQWTLFAGLGSVKG